MEVAPQLSLAVGAMPVTLFKQLASALTTLLEGHVMLGTSLSVTVTVKLHDVAFPLISVTVYEMVVTPLLNEVPVA
jgi:hypothetical protein